MMTDPTTPLSGGLDPTEPPEPTPAELAELIPRDPTGHGRTIARNRLAANRQRTGRHDDVDADPTRDQPPGQLDDPAEPVTLDPHELAARIPR